MSDQSLPLPADDLSPHASESKPVSPLAIPASHFRGVILFHIFFLSFASFFLVAQGASDEPYVRFRANQALAQLGGGCTLIAIWGYVLLATAYGLLTRRLPLPFLIVFPWATLVVVYLQVCPVGYLDDLAIFLR